MWDVERSVRKKECAIPTCNKGPIGSHLVPESWLRTIAADGKVIGLPKHLNARTLPTYEPQFYEDYFRSIKERPIGVGVFNNHHLLCIDHDQSLFGLLDGTDGDLSSDLEQHRLYYKSVLFTQLDHQQVLTTLTYAKEQRPISDVRELTLNFLRQSLSSLSSIVDGCESCTQHNTCMVAQCNVSRSMEFRRFYVPGDKVPSVAGIASGSGVYDCGCDDLRCTFARGEMLIACKPKEGGHIILVGRSLPNSQSLGKCFGRGETVSWNPPLEEFFGRTQTLQGEKLEIALSLLLIDNCNYLAFSPVRWERFGRRMLEVAKRYVTQGKSPLMNIRQELFPSSPNRRFNLFRHV